MEYWVELSGTEGVLQYNLKYLNFVSHDGSQYKQIQKTVSINLPFLYLNYLRLLFFQNERKNEMTKLPWNRGSNKKLTKLTLCQKQTVYLKSLHKKVVQHLWHIKGSRDSSKSKEKFQITVAKHMTKHSPTTENEGEKFQRLYFTERICVKIERTNSLQLKWEYMYL